MGVRTAVFTWIPSLAGLQNFLKGKSVGVDATTPEADAAIKSIVRRDTDEDWKEYLARQMKEEGLLEEVDIPSDDDLRPFDKHWKDKKVSNEEWVSETNPDARITKMKDGSTHLAYKAEHVVDLDSELIVAAKIYHADQADTHTLEDSVQQVQTNLRVAGSAAQFEDVAADKGYSANQTLTDLAQHTPCRTYILESQSPLERVWTDKPPEQKAAVHANRRRTRGSRGKQLQRLRSERVERILDSQLCTLERSFLDTEYNSASESGIV